MEKEKKKNRDEDGKLNPSTKCPQWSLKPLKWGVGKKRGQPSGF